MFTSLRTDFDAIPDGARIRLHPADANFIHLEPVVAERIGDGFYCDGSDALRRGPDYRLGDVAAFCRGYELVEVTA